MSPFGFRRRTPLDSAELAELLPAPGEADLSPDRHQLLREHLMSEIQRDDSPVAVPHRRRPRLVAPLTVAAAVIAVAAAVGVVTHWPASGAKHRPSTNAAAPPVSSSPSPAPDHRFTYSKETTVDYVQPQNDGTMSLGGPTTSSDEVWQSVDGSAKGRTIHRNGSRPPSTSSDAPADNVWFDFHGTYQYLSLLPTGRTQLRARIMKEVADRPGPRATAKTAAQAEATNDVSNILSSPVLPPGLTAPLFQIAATYPGITRIDDAVDAAGRHGVALGFRQEVETETPSGDMATQIQRVELIFDATSMTYLGSCTVQVNDAGGLHAGDVLNRSTVVSRGLVDKLGERPKK